MIPEELERNLPTWTSNVILEGYRGSHGHGTYIPSSEPNSTDDIDIFRVVVQPIEYYLSLRGYSKKQEHCDLLVGEYDILVYDIRKFIYLLSKGNPNVHNFLWLRPKDYSKITKAGKYLISKRTEVLTQKVIHSYSGYALAQLKKMTHFKYEGYMGAKRKKLAGQYGFDCRNAAHCIRLLLTAIDLLKTGEIKVYRSEDKDILIAIKTGKWNLEKVQRYADGLRIEFERLAKHNNFPPFVAPKRLETILLNTMQIAWDNK